MNRIEDFTDFDRQLTESSLFGHPYEEQDYPSSTDRLLHVPDEVDLPPLSEDLQDADGWERVDGAFTVIYAVNMPWINSDMHFAPEVSVDKSKRDTYKKSCLPFSVQN